MYLYIFIEKEKPKEMYLLFRIYYSLVCPLVYNKSITNYVLLMNCRVPYRFHNYKVDDVFTMLHNNFTLPYLY